MYHNLILCDFSVVIQLKYNLPLRTLINYKISSEVMFFTKVLSLGHSTFTRCNRFHGRYPSLADKRLGCCFVLASLAYFSHFLMSG